MTEKQRARRKRALARREKDVLVWAKMLLSVKASDPKYAAYDASHTLAKRECAILRERLGVS